MAAEAPNPLVLMAIENDPLRNVRAHFIPDEALEEATEIYLRKAHAPLYDRLDVIEQAIEAAKSNVRQVAQVLGISLVTDLPTLNLPTDPIRTRRTL